MNASTSRRGRSQFSLENAYSVSHSMPISRAVSTISRTESLPRRWPWMRLRLRACAQRPLPSMMMATWRGTGPEKTGRATSVKSGPRRSDGHDLVFLGLEDLVDLVNVFLGDLFDLLESPALVVFVDLF